MLRQGSSLDVIGAVLRYRCLDSAASAAVECLVEWGTVAVGVGADPPGPLHHPGLGPHLPGGDGRQVLVFTSSVAQRSPGSSRVTRAAPMA